MKMSLQFVVFLITLGFKFFRRLFLERFGKMYKLFLVFVLFVFEIQCIQDFLVFFRITSFYGVVVLYVSNERSFQNVKGFFFWKDTWVRVCIQQRQGLVVFNIMYYRFSRLVAFRLSFLVEKRLWLIYRVLEVGFICVCDGISIFRWRQVQ